jgi:hypothetical protein
LRRFDAPRSYQHASPLLPGFKSINYAKNAEKNILKSSLDVINIGVKALFVSCFIVAM